MKKLFLVAIACCIAAAVSAQLKITLVLNGAPPAQLSEWGNRREVLMLIVTSQPGQPAADFKIKTEIKTMDGTVIGTTDLAKASTYNIASTSVIFMANDVMPLDKMILTGKYKSSLQRSGKLPSDTYIMCVQLVRPVDFTPFSQQECKNFYLASIQLPILMKPYDGEVLDANIAQTAITFRWTPMVPKQSAPITYRVQVFEVLEHQSPVQAMRSNMPLLDQEVKGTTQYIWRPQLSFDIVGTWEGDCTGSAAEKNINTSEAGLGSGKDNKGTQKNINTSEAGLGSGKDNKSTQKNINTSEAGGGTGKDKKSGQKNINTSEDNLGSGKMTKNTGMTQSQIEAKADYDLVDHCQKFIWTVQTLDDHGLPVTQTDGSGEGRSEPIVFIVKMKAKEKGNR